MPGSADAGNVDGLWCTALTLPHNNWIYFLLLPIYFCIYLVRTLRSTFHGNVGSVQEICHPQQAGDVFTEVGEKYNLCTQCGTCFVFLQDRNKQDAVTIRLELACQGLTLLWRKGNGRPLSLSSGRRSVVAIDDSWGSLCHLHQAIVQNVTNVNLWVTAPPW